MKKINENNGQNKKVQKQMELKDYSQAIQKTISTLENTMDMFKGMPKFTLVTPIIAKLIHALSSVLGQLYVQSGSRMNEAITIPIDKMDKLDVGQIDKMSDKVDIRFEEGENNVVKIDITKLSAEQRADFHKELSTLMAKYDGSSIMEYKKYTKSEYMKEMLEKKAKKNGYVIEGVYTKKQLAEKYKKNG